MLNISSESKHPKIVYLIGLSILLQKASYYGFKTILMPYMIDTLHLPESESSEIYSYFVGSNMFLIIIGALLGDFLLGNRKTLFLGLLFQLIGISFLCIPQINFLYLGLACTAIGSAFYLPNLLSRFGQNYLDKSSLLDGGFTLIYFAITIGSFIAPVLIMWLESKGVIYAQLMIGVLIIFSFLLSFNATKKVSQVNVESKKVAKHSYYYLTLLIILFSFFWYVNDLIKEGASIIREGEYFSGMQMYQVDTIVFICTFISSIIACILWSKFYLNQIIKLIFNFSLIALMLIVLLISLLIPFDKNIGLSFCLSLVLSLTQIIIAPILYSTICYKFNPKCFASLIAVSLALTSLPGFLFGKFKINIHEVNTLSIAISLIIAILIILILIIAFKKYNQESEVQLIEG